ncbi:MAG: hypothetical protein K2H64_07940 [Desulfovibrio sp.]|nr:hypothetical protein [Desulfovibrio sp.]
MIIFNPIWGGLDYIQDTPPQDGMAIVFLPSVVSDPLAGKPQLESEESVQSFMQSQFRAVAENMRETGLIVGSDV